MFNRILFFTLLKTLFGMGLLLGHPFCPIAYAHQATVPWVIDEQDLLSPNETGGIAHVLASTASNRGIHVRVLLVKVHTENAKEIIDQKVVEYKNRIPYSNKEKTSFLIINLATNEAKIVLGNEIQRTDPLIKSLVRIQNEIVLPGLAQGDVKAAVSQGAVAIATVLDIRPVSSSSSSLWQSFKTWLSSYYLWTPMQILFWLALFFGVAYVVNRYVNRPNFNADEVDMVALQETIIENSLMLRQQYSHYSDPY